VGRIVHFEITADDIDRPQRSSASRSDPPQTHRSRQRPRTSRRLGSGLTRLLCFLLPTPPLIASPPLLGDRKWPHHLTEGGPITWPPTQRTTLTHSRPLDTCKDEHEHDLTPWNWST
jgi:hypothetical protein